MSEEENRNCGKCGQKYDSCKCKDQEPEDDDIEDMFDNDTTPIEESYHKCRKCGEIFKP